jgi:uncharacterized protein with FMN-binding domain
MRGVILASAGTVAGLVLLLSFKTHSTAGAPAAAIGGAVNGAAGNGAGSGAAPARCSAPSSKSSGSCTAAGVTVTGDPASTRFGPVQVRITVKKGAITNVSAVEYPMNDALDQQINTIAIPELNKEALAAQKAQIQAISGATYTTEGYVSSLQSALDKAGL